MIQWYWLVAWIVSFLLLDALHEHWRHKDEKAQEAERADWHRERQKLLDRIQAPSLAVYKALEQIPVSEPKPKPEVERVDPI